MPIRRVLLVLAALAVVAATTIGVLVTRDSEPKVRVGGPPNILVVMLDDMRADELQFMPTTQQWVVDRGLEFRNAFSPFPLCCPARASLLTGQYAHNHRVVDTVAPYGFGSFDDSRTLGGAMQDAGYRTGFIGKYLNGYGPMKSKVTGKSSVDYVPAGWTDWMASLDGGWGGRGNTYNYYGMTQNVNGEVRYNDGKYSSTVIAEQTAGLVHEYAGTGDPFFLLVNVVAPHRGGPREKDDPKTLATSKGQLKHYPTPARPKWSRGTFDDKLPAALGVPVDGSPSEAAIGDKPRLMQALPEPTAAEKLAMREVERQRAESIYAWDVEFKKVVKALEETGTLENTVVVVTSDNGYYNGEHRQRTGKIRAHDPVIRVPVAIAGPGVARGLRQVPLTTMDLTATLLDLADAPALPGMDGTSRAPQLGGADAPWNVPVVTEGRLPALTKRPGFPADLNTGGLLTGRYQLTMYNTGEGELYDLWQDPLQMESLYGDPEHRALRDRLVALWQRYRSCAGEACRAPLPQDLQVGDPKLAQEDGHRLAAIEAYYR